MMKNNNTKLGRRYNPLTDCYEAPNRKPIPASEMDVYCLADLFSLLTRYGDGLERSADEQ
jgi:hypothetical protein